MYYFSFSANLQRLNVLSRKTSSEWHLHLLASILFEIALHSLKIEFLHTCLFLYVSGWCTRYSFISYTFKNTLNAEVYIEDLIFMGTEECGKYRLQEVYLYLTIFIKSNVVRKDMEERLLGFTESSSGLAKAFERLTGLPSSEEVVNVSKSLQSMFLPSLLSKLDK